ncbi:MAG: hypothetical protein P8M02_04075, partial [Flavobacteriaceae bacterium]|nr:hypothetical protein [Flavobacteriaceae bacterium]
MKSLNCFFLFLLVHAIHSQQVVKGYLVNAFNEPLSGCELSIPESSVQTVSAEDGFFSLELTSHFKEVELFIKTPERDQQIVPIVFNTTLLVDLGRWKVMTSEQFIDSASQLDWDALFEEDSGMDRGQIGSILQSQRDRLLNTAAFQFSPTFFRLRGLDSGYQEVRLNGIPVQSFFRGSPQWSQWGGLNDFTNRGQQLYMAASPQIHGKGGFLSTTQINLQPSLFRSGAKISQAFSNSSYRFRTQFSIVEQPKGNSLGYGILFSRRWGRQGFVKGTPYEAYSGTLLLEKNWSDQHSSWFTALYTPNSRGKSAPLTKEVFELKGNQYNPYWGMQSGRIRNSRVVRTKTPIVLLNHRWQLREGQFLKFNFGWVWGIQSSSRLGYNGHQFVD